MIMSPPEQSVESQHSYCPNGDITWCKYHKDKIFNRNIYMIDQNVYDVCFAASFMSMWAHSNQNESINNMIWSKCRKRVCSKIRFVISVCE